MVVATQEGVGISPQIAGAAQPGAWTSPWQLLWPHPLLRVLGKTAGVTAF